VTSSRPYADLVAAVLDLRPNLAGQRLDAEVAAAQAAGRLDDETARTLRYWQRAWQRELIEHATAVLPAVLDTLTDAAYEAQIAHNTAAQALDRARHPGLNPVVAATDASSATTLDLAGLETAAGSHPSAVSGLVPSPTNATVARVIPSPVRKPRPGQP
jgi:hypothetical protein